MIELRLELLPTIISLTQKLEDATKLLGHTMKHLYRINLEIHKIMEVYLPYTIAIRSSGL